MSPFWLIVPTQFVAVFGLNLFDFRIKEKELVYVVSGSYNYGASIDNTFDPPIRDIVAFTSTQFNLRKTTFGVLWANGKDNIQIVSPMTNDVKKAENMMTAFLDNRPQPKHVKISGLAGSIEYAMHNMFSANRESIKVFIALTHWNMPQEDITEFLSWSCNRLVILVLAFPWPFEKCSYGEIRERVQFVNDHLNSTGFLQHNMANCGRNFEVLENFQQLLYNVWPAHENLVNWCDVHQPVTTTEDPDAGFLSGFLGGFFSGDCEGFVCFSAPFVTTTSITLGLPALLFCYCCAMRRRKRMEENAQQRENDNLAANERILDDEEFAMLNDSKSQLFLLSNAITEEAEHDVEDESRKSPEGQESTSINEEQPRELRRSGTSENPLLEMDSLGVPSLSDITTPPPSLPEESPRTQESNPMAGRRYSKNPQLKNLHSPRSLNEEMNQKSPRRRVSTYAAVKKQDSVDVTGSNSKLPKKSGLKPKKEDKKRRNSKSTISELMLSVAMPLVPPPEIPKSTSLPEIECNGEKIRKRDKTGRGGSKTLASLMKGSIPAMTQSMIETENDLKVRQPVRKGSKTLAHLMMSALPPGMTQSMHEQFDSQAKADFEPISARSTNDLVHESASAPTVQRRSSLKPNRR